MNVSFYSYDVLLADRLYKVVFSLNILAMHPNSVWAVRVHNMAFSLINLMAN